MRKHCIDKTGAKSSRAHISVHILRPSNEDT